MEELVQHAEAALRAYLERGERVLSALNSDKLDTGIRRMGWRNGAFQRFLRVDSLAHAQGLDLSAEPRLQSIFHLLVAQERSLVAALAMVRDQTAQELQQHVAVRKIIGKYRSQSSDGQGFQSII